MAASLESLSRMILRQRLSAILLLILILLIGANCARPCLASGNVIPSSLPAAPLSATNLCLRSDSVPSQFDPPLISCPPGYWCPNFIPGNATTFPTFCLPTVECQLSLLKGEFCVFQGFYQPQLCPDGFYCPGAGNVLVESESGTWSPGGQTQPISCPPLSSCPASSIAPLYWGGLIYIAIADVVVFLLIQFREQRRRHRVKQNEAATQKNPALAEFKQSPARSGSKDKHAILSHMKSLKGSISRLATSFLHARDSQPVKQLQFDFQHVSLTLPTPTLIQSAVPSILLDLIPASILTYFQEPEGVKQNSNGRKLLADVNGQLLPGKLTAIMGPSGADTASRITNSAECSSLRRFWRLAPDGSKLVGDFDRLCPRCSMPMRLPMPIDCISAGKTTFLHTLMNKVPSWWQRHGELTINGRPEAEIQWRHLLGYVPQDNIMHYEVTVREAIEYSANIRLPATFTAEERRNHVDLVLAVLGLTSVADSLIGNEVLRGISGGQKVKTHAKPFTSFLNRCLSLLILRKDALDTVLLLAPGGRTVFQGKRAVCVAYLDQFLGTRLGGHDSPADEILDAIQLRGAEFADAWEFQGGPARVAILENHLLGLEENAIALEREQEDAAAAVAAASPSLDLADEQKALVGHSIAPGGGPAVSLNVDPSFKPVAPVVPLEVSEAASGPVSVSVSGSHGAAFWRQVIWAHNRAIMQQLSTPVNLLMEILVVGVIAIILGASGAGGYSGALTLTPLSPSPGEGGPPSAAFYVCLAIALAAGTKGIRVTGLDEQPVYWRETAAGHNTLAYFIAVNAAQIVRMIVVAMHFTIFYMILATPAISYGGMFGIILLMFWCIYGLCTVVVPLVPRRSAAVAIVIVGVVLCTGNGYTTPIPVGLDYLGPAYWFSEYFFNEQVGPFLSTMDVNHSASLWGYQLNRTAMDIGFLVLIGFIYRCVGYGTQIGAHRDKQR